MTDEELARDCLYRGGADYSELEMNRLARAYLEAKAQLAAQAPVVEAAERFVAASDDDYDDSLYENLSREVIALRKSRAGGS